MATRTLLTLAWLALLAAPAHAQDDTPPDADTAAPDSTAEPPAEYATRIREALEESDQGNWTDARAAFREAHALFPNARTLRGMGMVSFEMRDYVDCVRHLRRSLANEVRPLTERQHVEVEALLERALERVAVFTLAEVPEGAVISVDGRVVEREEDGSLLLAIGEHALTVEAGTRWESRIPVRGGENEPLPMVFVEPEADPDPGPSGPAVLAPARPTETPVSAVVLTIAGIVAIVAGGVVAIAGAVDFFSVHNAARDTEWDRLSGANDRTAFLQGIGYATMGVGLALTISGAVWLGMGGGSDSAQLRVGGTF